MSYFTATTSKREWQCDALAVKDTMWSFCPNLRAADVFAVLFGLTTLTHLVQAIIYKKPYCWVIVASGMAQTLAYVLRILSILNPASFGFYAGWFVLILVAPLFTNAFVYMVMGRMIWNYVPEKKIHRVTAWRFGMYFVVLDVCALVIQIIGAVQATGENTTTKQVLRGLHMYMGGVGVQLGFILLFLFFAVKFHRIVRQQNSTSFGSPGLTHALILLYNLYTVLGFIILRIIFRLIEYAQGLDSGIPNKEGYQYGLDSLPMLIALVLLDAFHPGRIMKGEESDIPSRKERKLAGVASKSTTRTTETMEMV